jgi:hypothetical protein
MRRRSYLRHEIRWQREGKARQEGGKRERALESFPIPETISAWNLLLKADTCGPALSALMPGSPQPL